MFILVCMSLCMYVYVYACPSLCVCLLVSLSVYVCVCLTLCVCVSVPLALALSFSLPLCPSSCARMCAFARGTVPVEEYCLRCAVAPSLRSLQLYYVRFEATGRALPHPSTSGLLLFSLTYTYSYSLSLPLTFSSSLQS